MPHLHLSEIHLSPINQAHLHRRLIDLTRMLGDQFADHFVVADFSIAMSCSMSRMLASSTRNLINKIEMFG
jgi:hypothetical protein